MNRLLLDMGFESMVSPIIYEDNQGAIALAKNPVSHKRTKHIDIRYHFIRECVNRGSVELKYCPTASMIADVLTKRLATSKFIQFRSSMGIME